MDIYSQLKNIDPSVKGALYRRLMSESNLAYLRTGDAGSADEAVIGFELDLEQAKPLMGYTLVAIQRHTILAYRSDIDEPPKLILFPSIDKLSDSAFDLLTLEVTKCLYKDSTFVGQPLKKGRLVDVAQDMTPPQRSLELPADLSETITKAMLDASNESRKRNTSESDIKPDIKPEESAPETTGTEDVDDPEWGDYPEDDWDNPSFDDDTPPFDDQSFDDWEGSVSEEPSKEDLVAEKVGNLRAQHFKNVNDVIDYAVQYQGLQKPDGIQIATGAMGVSNDEAVRVEVTIRLLEKFYMR